MELLARIVNSWKSLTFFVRTTIFSIWQGPECASDIHEKKLHSNTILSTPSGFLCQTIFSPLTISTDSFWSCQDFLINVNVKYCGYCFQCCMTATFRSTKGIKPETFYVCQYNMLCTLYFQYLIEIFSVCYHSVYSNS